MVTAMQGQIASTQETKHSVSEEMFWELLPYPATPGADDKLFALAEVCAREAEAAVEAAEPDEKCFALTVTVYGKWAQKALLSSHMTMANYPKTKMRLGTYVADGWLASRTKEDEESFADTLRYWPVDEAREAADQVRETIEFRLRPKKPEDLKEYLMCLGRFFNAPQIRCAEDGKKIARTVFKAIGMYADAADVVLLGQAFCILHGPRATPFQDFIRRALED